MSARSMATVYAFPVRSSVIRPGLWARLAEMAETRRTRRLLAEMDDHMLADIGMDRAGAHAEANRRVWDLGGRGW